MKFWGKFHLFLMWLWSTTRIFWKDIKLNSKDFSYFIYTDNFLFEFEMIWVILLIFSYPNNLKKKGVCWPIEYRLTTEHVRQKIVKLKYSHHFTSFFSPILTYPRMADWQGGGVSGPLESGIYCAKFFWNLENFIYNYIYSINQALR